MSENIFAKKTQLEYLAKAREKALTLADFTLETTETAYRDLSEELGIKAGEIIHPTRLPFPAGPGPGLFDIMVILGKEKTLERMERAVQYIENLSTELFYSRILYKRK